VSGLAQLAATRGWQPRTDAVVSPQLGDLVHRLSWILYGRQYATTIYETTSIQHATVFRDGYGGEVDGRGVVVANAWTNIGPQDVVKLLKMMGVAVCAVELPTISPFVLVQPHDLPAAAHVPTTPTGNAEFDERFTVGLLPGVDIGVVTPEMQRRIAAHDDWAFVADANWLACLRRGAFTSADEVSRRLDEVLGIVAAVPTQVMPAQVMPAQVDHSVDDLAARIKGLSSVEDALALLQQLTPDDREQLAKSNTPLARFADVRTPDEAIARFETLDNAQRMQLLAMFERVDEK